MLKADDITRWLRTASKLQEKFGDSVKGFGIRANGKGGGSWVFVYTPPGAGQNGVPKRRRYIIGDHDKMTLAKARAIATGLKDQVTEQGRDPAGERDEKRTALEVAAADTTDTFSALVERYFTRHSVERGYQDAPNMLSSIKRNVMVEGRDWSSRKAVAITGADISKATGAVVDAGKEVAANYLHKTLRQVFRWGVGQRFGGLTESPVQDMDMPGVQGDGARLLEVHELPMIWKAAVVIGYPFGDFTRLVMLTGKRRKETSLMKWSCLDLDAGTWRIPAADQANKGRKPKNGDRRKDHVVQLSALAVDILRDILAKGYVWAGCDLVFPAGRMGQDKDWLPVMSYRPMTGWSNRLAALSDLAEVEGWSLHSLRKTMAQTMRKLGVHPDIRYHCLNQQPEGDLQKTYSPNQEPVPMRRAWFRWADWLRCVIDDDEAGRLALEVADDATETTPETIAADALKLPAEERARLLAILEAAELEPAPRPAKPKLHVVQ